MEGYGAGIQFLFTPDMLTRGISPVPLKLGFSSYLPLICLGIAGAFVNFGWDSVLIYP